jgi:hypothetical protein
MSRPEAERARAFLQRADADLAAVRALESLSEVPDEIVGFHGQQAAEKLLKAVLAAHGIDFPRTHSIRFLLDLLDDRGLAPPAFGPFVYDLGSTTLATTQRCLPILRSRMNPSFS